MNKYLFILVGVMSFAACKNCDERTYGYIIDNAYRKPLPNVKVRSVGALDGREKDERIVYSDSTGYFQTQYKSKGTAKCPVLKLEISADGYHTLRTTAIQQGDTVVMVLAE